MKPKIEASPLQSIVEVDPDFSWCDSNSFIQDEEGTLRPAGTCLKLNDYIMFLSSLTKDQLVSLRESVNGAVSNELNKRPI